MSGSRVLPLERGSVVKFDDLEKDNEAKRRKADAEYVERSGARELGTIEVDGIDTSDAPDFCDAFISYAEWSDGTPLTDKELDRLNEDGELVLGEVHKRLY